MRCSQMSNADRNRKNKPVTSLRNYALLMLAVHKYVERCEPFWMYRFDCVYHINAGFRKNCSEIVVHGDGRQTNNLNRFDFDLVYL